MDKRGTPSFVWIYVLMLVLALVFLGVGIYLAAGGHGWAMLAAGAVSLIGVLIAWPLAWGLGTMMNATVDCQNEMLQLLKDRLEQVSIMLNLISEQQLLSDRAKAVAFREKDREAVRRAISEEINAGDWEAARLLANEMETQFGYRLEAERLREEIDSHFQEAIRKQIAEAAAVIDRHCRAEKWNEALRDAERLMRQFPKNEQVQRLPQEIEARRLSHKRQLLDNWQESVNRKDIDGSIEILKRLDLYLTPTEAEGMQESVRAVFRAKIDSLRTQFTSAVQEHRWVDALRTGEAIVRDFPNAKISQEVRDMLNTLRERAGVAEESRMAEAAGRK